MRDAVLGVDVGTGSLKAGLFALDGSLLGLTQAAYPLWTPEDDARLQDPEDWWQALATCCRRLAADHAAEARIQAIAIGGQAPTLAPADAEFRPTAPAITWLDPRPAAEAERMYGKLGQPVPVWGSWPSQAAWFLHNRRDEANRTRWLFGCPDYLASRLTQTATALLSVSEAEIEAAELDPRLIPPAWTPGGIIGRVAATSAAETLLPLGLPVVGGHVDGLLGVLGTGVAEPGDGCMNSGTSGTFSTVCLPPLGYPMLGLQIAGSATNTSGRALDWFVQQIHSGGCDYDALLAEAAAIPAGACGLLFLPHLAGERGITRDPYSRGAWVGLTLDHDRRHLLRALLEGVAFSFRSIQDWLESLGANVLDVRCVGGQARSDVWNQIKADVLNRPVLVPEVIEAAAAGAAILAALGVGGYATLEEARAAMVRVDRRFEPDPGRADLYSNLYDSFCGLYPAVREINWRLHDLSKGHAVSAAA